jgi:2-polyprenyl-3-methyl-5-hydroxy-6-metoxy-1,4-benzoquinol methylase
VDAVERLSLEQAGAQTLLALTHVHRYEVAAELCAGMRVLDLCCGSGYGTRLLSGRAAAVTGVDSHEPSIERARAELGDGDRIAFERGDAHEWLERPLAEDFDAIVLLEGVEHLADPQKAIEQLRRHAEAGLTLVVSLPNSKPFREENPHHVSEFDFESAHDVFDRLPGATVLYQFHAEGSLIRSAPGGELEGRVTLTDRAEAEYCNHFLAIVNADSALASLAESTRMQLNAAPVFNRYMLDLERENRMLWRANQRLARDKVGTADSAAASALNRRHGGGAPELPASLEPVAVVGTKLAKGLATIVLNILPHALTLVVLRIRARLRQDQSA